MEYELADLNARYSETSANLQATVTTKKKLENEIAMIQGDLEDSVRELKNADETKRKAMADAARLGEELRNEQEHSMHVERMRKDLEMTLKVFIENFAVISSLLFEFYC